MAESKSLQVEIIGLKEIQKNFQRAPEIVEPILQRTVEAAQFALQKHTLKDNPVPWRTGNLLQSFRFQKGRLQGSWFPTAEYAMSVYYPRPASGEGGKGYPGNPYMDAILENAEDDVNGLFVQALDKIVKAL